DCAVRARRAECRCRALVVLEDARLSQPTHRTPAPLGCPIQSGIVALCNPPPIGLTGTSGGGASVVDSTAPPEWGKSSKFGFAPLGAGDVSGWLDWAGTDGTLGAASALAS